jgi:cobalt-precorrin 5A hydrolase
MSDAGAGMARNLVESLPSAVFLHDSVSASFSGYRFSRLHDLIGELFQQFQTLIFFATCGTVVRVLSPHLLSRGDAPAVIVADSAARYVVSLLPGRIGNINALTVEVANLLGAEPVTTGTSDSLKNLIVGVGCRRGTSAERIVNGIRDVVESIGSSVFEVRLLAGVDLRAEEAGLQEAAHVLNIPLRLVPSEEILAYSRSIQAADSPKRVFNLSCGAEPAALLAGSRTRLVMSKRIWGNLTIAVAREDASWSSFHSSTDRFA